MKIQLVRGAVRWHYRVVARNGQVLSHSQGYFSKSNAQRAAVKLATALKLKVVE